MTGSKPPAIIIGGGSGNGLGIARNLGRLGIDVYCVTSNPRELTRFSKYCTGSAIVPNIERDADTLQRFLAAFQPYVADRGVLFPTEDTALLTVTQIRSRLAKYVTYLPRRDLVETMVIKSKFYRSLDRWGVPHPRTLLLDNPDWSTVEWDAQYPVYIRPVQSRLFAQRFGRKGFVAQNLREVRAFLHAAQRSQLAVMLQEIIPGPTENLYHLRGYFDRDSQPIVLLAHHKLRQPTMFSDNCALVSIPLSEIAEAVNLILEYFQNIRYTGLFGADFKRDPRDGRLKLLEINARSQGGNYFGVECGANHVLAAYHDSLGEPVQPIHTYRVGTYHFNLLSDLNVLLKMAVRGQLSGRDLAPFFRNRHWNILSFTDGSPFLKHAWGEVTHALRERGGGSR